jgi:hypothetical protein
MVGNNRACEANNPLGGTDKLLHAAEYERGITDHPYSGARGAASETDRIWPLDDRVKWLRTATGIFDLVYKAGDD